MSSVQLNIFKYPSSIKKVISQQLLTFFLILLNLILSITVSLIVGLDFVDEGATTSKALLKSWIFELKHIRNTWAHSAPEHLDYRLANRVFDTLSLVYTGFKGDKQSQLFEKIQFYRKKLLIATAKNYYHSFQL